MHMCATSISFHRSLKCLNLIDTKTHNHIIMRSSLSYIHLDNKGGLKTTLEIADMLKCIAKVYGNEVAQSKIINFICSSMLVKLKCNGCH